MSTALTIRNEMDVMSLGAVLAESGYFQDARGAAQAVVKILAGAEMGFGPIASMTGINIIKGKVAPSANILAAAVKRSEKYDYTVTAHDAEQCIITFWQRSPTGEMVEIGESPFTKDDADNAGLKGDNWTKYPRNMMFARAMSNGARWFCPDILGGPLYTPEELGAIVDGETGEIVDVKVPEDESPPDSTPVDHGKFSRPMPANITREALHTRGGWVKGKANDYSDAHRPPDDQREPPDDRLVQRVAALMGKALQRPEGGDTDLERHLVLQWVFGVEKTGLLTALEAQATARWLEAEAGNWIPSGVASEECRLVLHQAMADAGQTELQMEHPDAE